MQQVLHQHSRVKTFSKNLTVNVVGGMDLRGDTSVDLALAIAIASSIYDRPIALDVACVGELGLAGEVRAVSGLQRRIGGWCRGCRGG